LNNFFLNGKARQETMKMNLSSCLHKKVIVLGLACVILLSCASGKKTGTVTDGIVKGIAVANDGSLGQLNVELTVKLDDGNENQGDAFCRSGQSAQHETQARRG
jgi:hypothetical protein